MGFLLILTIHYTFPFPKCLMELRFCWQGRVSTWRRWPAHDGRITVEHVECGGACGGAPAVCVNWELIEGVEPDKGRALVRWLRDAEPEVLSADEMQLLFGGQRSFDWGPAEPEGAIAPLPAFAPYGTAGEV